MKKSVSDNKSVKKVTPKAENSKGIENHKKAAMHYKAAAKNHLDAAKHHENGEDELAAKCTVEAHGHSCLAIEAQKEDGKHHATNK